MTRKHEFEKGFELKTSTSLLYSPISSLAETRGVGRILDSYANPRLRLGFA